MGPSAPSAIPALDTTIKVRRKSPEALRSSSPAGSTPLSSFYFAEFFAGQGGLTKAMLQKGIRCREADEVEEGGIDFRRCEEVAKLKEELRTLRTEGAQLSYFTSHLPALRSHAPETEQSQHA